jgi:hypothetical protein
MATFRGLVNTLQIRNDGWVEVVIQAVHAGNTTQTLYIKDLDGDITMAHKRLGQLSLLRDALTRILPVEIDYETDPDQGDLITEVMVHPRPSIAGRAPGSLVQGTVIGISITELGPLSGLYPYLDTPDIAGITLLKEDGTLLSLQLDLQRSERLTMHAMLGLLKAAYINRRPVILLTADQHENKLSSGSDLIFNSSSFATNRSAFIESCEWVSIPEETLHYCYAFIERIGQRYESYDEKNALALSHIRVVYTTAPAQTPEGDISENGAFLPVTQTAWIPDASPLLMMLEMALKNSFQVQLGTLEEYIHEVDVISHLGSSARPIWICVTQSFMQENLDEQCNNTPTIQSPNNAVFGDIPLRFYWKGKGYFNEGIWRFKIDSASASELKIDGKLPCCSKSIDECCCTTDEPSSAVTHVYLKGLHTIELTLYNQKIGQPFTLTAYRIR